MLVEVEKLRTVVLLLLARIELHGLSDFDVNLNLYWKISSDERYVNSSEPRHINAGSLFDDISDIERIFSGHQSPLVSHLQQLAALFDYMGSELADRVSGDGG